MTKKIKELKVAFENCEIFTVKSEYLEWFYVSGVTDTYYSNKTMAGLELSSSRTAKDTTVKFSRAVDNEKLSIEEDKTPIERITECSDLVSFVIVYEDESEEEIYVNWIGDNEYYNPAQKVELLDKSIVITICEENVNN